MARKNLKVFLDTSVIIAAMLSPWGVSRQVFLLGEAGLLDLLVGPNVMREADAVVRRKVPASLPQLALLLDAARVGTSHEPGRSQIEMAQQHVDYFPDAIILAETLTANPDWFITHDKTHFLSQINNTQMVMKIGTPGDLIVFIREMYE